MIKFDCNDGCIHEEVCKHIPAIKELQRAIDHNGYLTAINADVVIKCKNYESRSDECLAEPKNLHSRKPVKWEDDGDGKGKK